MMINNQGVAVLYLGLMVVLTGEKDVLNPEFIQIDF